MDAGGSPLILAIFCLVLGRLWPLILSHYVRDAIPIVMLVTLIRKGVIQF